MDYTIETHSLRKIYKRKIVVNDVNIHVKKGKYTVLSVQTEPEKVL